MSIKDGPGCLDEMKMMSFFLSGLFCLSLMSVQPLPESMVARLCESKKVCGAADTQLQVQ